VTPWRPLLVSGDATAAVDSQLSVGVADIDSAYADAQRRGYEIVHPLTDETWGVRRFFVRDPKRHRGQHRRAP
jgi:uncharacterized glyoxalase superfamily protein PhnB